MSTFPAPIEIFFSYANADEALCQKLEKHLSLLGHEGLITTWHKRKIIAGTDWTKTLDRQLKTASVILLLVSADFLASDYCYGMEMQRAMKRHEANEACVIPILLRPVDWQSAPFGKLQALPSNSIPITLWGNQDAAFADIAQGIRVALQKIQLLAISTPPTSLPRIWNIPYPYNPVFTGREEVLTHLTNIFKTGQSTALSQPLAISGLGGIGKTQVAVEYAYRQHQDYQAVFWVLADTRESLVSGYIAIARLLNLPEKDNRDQTIIIKAVIRWLATHSEWLLILDNADDLILVYELLPPTFGGHLLLTTRAQTTGSRTHRIEVEIMQQNIGALFLLRRAKLIAFNASPEDAAISDVARAREICKELGGLPLALDQAGAYVEETQCSLSQYLERYWTHRKVLLQRRGRLVVDHPEPVSATWSLSFERIEQENLAAVDLLRICAFLAPDAIPEAIFSRGAKHLGTHLSDPLLLDEAIAVLGAYSLVHRNTQVGTISIHRLVQTVLKDALSEETRRDWAERTVRTINAVQLSYTGTVQILDGDTLTLTPSANSNTVEIEQLLPHAQTCAQLIREEEMTFLEAGQVLHWTGAHTSGEEAKVFLRQALTWRVRHLGEVHLDTVETLVEYAKWFSYMAQYEPACVLCEHAIVILAQLLGPEHPATVSAFDILESFIPWEDKDKVNCYGFALVICEQHLGSEHPITRAIRDHLRAIGAKGYDVGFSGYDPSHLGFYRYIFNSYLE